jgi:hypothetical protein
VTLLQDLVDGAAGDTVPVATLLRRLKVIAARADAAPLDEWITHELGGYPPAVTLPAYRRPLQLVVTGHFVGPHGQQAENVPIQALDFPQEWRSGFFDQWLRDPVARLQQSAEDEYRLLPWPADAVHAASTLMRGGRIASAVGPGMSLVAAYALATANVYVGVLDAVRTRVLDLALELEKTAPDAGRPNAPVETTAAVQQVVINHFQSITGNVAIASDGVTQTVTVQLPMPGDEAGLLRYLGAHGVDPAQLIALREAIEQDRQSAGGQQPRTARVRAWLAQATTDLATNTAGGMLAAVAPGVIAAAVKAFLGG